MPSMYTHSANGRTWKLFGCAKRGCDKVSPDYLSVGVGDKGYCIDHVPLFARLRMRWQDRIA